MDSDFPLGLLMGVILMGFVWFLVESLPESACERSNNVYDCERPLPWYTPAPPEASL